MNLEKNDFCVCSHLNENGFCNYYEYRDEACRQYPNLEFFYMEYLAGDVGFYVPFCTYRSVILQSLNIPFEILLSGEKCQEKYLQMIREDSSIANQFHGKERLLKQAYEINENN